MRFSCNICAGNEVRRRENRGDGNRVLFCADCGMGVIENPPASTSSFYSDGYYGRKDDEDLGYVDYAFTAEHGLLWVQLMVQAVAPGGGSVLDVGCADGFLLHRLQGPYRRFGIEVNAAAAAQARARGVIVLGDDIMATNVTAGGEPSFDVITSIATFEHVLDFRGAVAACLNLLAPGGVLLFEVPLISDTRDNKDWYHGSYEHIFYPTVPGLERLFGSFKGLRFFGFESDIKGFSSSYIGMASFDAAVFDRVQRLLTAMYQPGLGGLGEKETRLNLAYHVVHSFRPNAERINALPTLLQVASAPNLVKRLTQLWHNDAVLADAWRNTETLLLAGTSSLAIAQTALNKLSEELNLRQQQFAAQREADTKQLAADRAQQEQAFARQQDILRDQQETLRGQQELLRQQQQALAGEQQALASEQQALAGERQALAGEQQALASEQQTLASEQQALASEQQEVAARAAWLEHQIAVYRPLLRLRRFVLGSLGRRD
jgi:SAM-dependent methyltransferase